jgi:hypothetical protein
MTKQQERIFSMYKNIKDCLATNSNILNDLPQYSVHYALFEASLNQIAIVQAKQLRNTTKLETKNKAILREKLISSIEKLIAAIDVHILITKNNDLQQTIPLFITKYKQTTDLKFVALCNNLYKVSFPFSIDLAGYGIDADLFTDFRNNIDDYTAVIVSPRQKTIANTETTTELANLFTIIKKQLNNITVLVRLKKFSEPLFYANFVASSKILNNGHTPYALHITLKGNDTLSLRNFTFTFTRQSDGKVVEYKTNPNGRIVRLDFKAGVYNLSIHKTGYTTKLTTITAESAITYKMTVVVNTNDNTFDIL